MLSVKLYQARTFLNLRTSHYDLWCRLVAVAMHLGSSSTRTTSPSLLRTCYGLVSVYCCSQIQLRRHTTSHTSHTIHYRRSRHVNSIIIHQVLTLIMAWWSRVGLVTEIALRAARPYKEEKYYIFLFCGKPFGFDSFTQDDSAWPFISK